jgi:hydrogenase maturation protein HypF
MADERRELRLAGVVQGVGLRPWAVRQARRHALGGGIRNTADGVDVSLEGEPASIDAWLRDLARTPPPGLRLESLEQRAARPVGERAFRIVRSDPNGASGGLPPDAPVCRACLDELLDPSSRRFGYAFTHCADCGPRASVLRALPWDRERTTLAPFPLCADCLREYEDPEDRRYHAEGIACRRAAPVWWRAWRTAQRWKEIPSCTRCARSPRGGSSR